MALLCFAQEGTSDAQTKKKATGGAGMSEAARGVQLAQQGAHEEAIAAFTKAIEANPKDARFYNDRGGVYLTIRRFKEAAEDFTKSIELAPKDPNGYS
ncbi:MAG: tetratricopeptide repeat protein, partial [Chthoniobacterales bacterium]|nr:tetratricopeptide repeat protein [Chthoniobacterales bacterium]